MNRKLSVFAAVASAVCIGLRAPCSARDAENPFAKLGHIVVIYTENRSFDNVFGLFPGAEGLSSAQNVLPQVDTDGSPLPNLPRVLRDRRPDGRFPSTLPNAPFAMGDFVPIAEKTGDLAHEFYLEQEQIDGGRMDRFAAVSDAGGLVMGYYDGHELRQWALAREFTLADHFFHGAFGGSFLNHFFLVCACVPVFPGAPPELVASIDERTGFLAKAADSPASALLGPPRWAHPGKVTGDGYAINTLQPAAPIAPGGGGKKQARLPWQTMPTIGDRLSEKGVSWAWYAGGWTDVVAGRLEPDAAPERFVTHHQPFAYFAAYQPGTKQREEHLKDAGDFFAAIEAGALPAVAFYKPIGKNDGHPGYSDLVAEDAHVADIVARLRAGPNWSDMLIVVAADENGGAWDHVAPPRIDRWGPGTRVPALLISPLVKKGYVDHTIYDTASILKTIETRFSLEPLGARDARANDLRNAMEAAR